MAPNSVNHQHSDKAQIAHKEAKAFNHALSFQQLPKLLKARIACKAGKAYMAPNSVNHQHSAEAPIAPQKAKAPNRALSFQQLPKLLKAGIAYKAAKASQTTKSYMALNSVNYLHSA